MNGDWRESLDWMGNNTPDTGVNYFTIYDKNTFHVSQPVLRGHVVVGLRTYDHVHCETNPQCKSIPAGVTGPDGSLHISWQHQKITANTILDHDGTRYVITDIEMDTGKFWAMATWYNSTAAAAPYQMTCLMPSQTDPKSYESVLLNEEPYYHTTISRLHNFDGSMTQPTTVYYVEYADSVSVTGVVSGYDKCSRDERNRCGKPGSSVQPECPVGTMPLHSAHQSCPP